MNLSITTEHRFQRTPDGAVWSLTMFPNSFWQRYRDVFNEVRVIARVQDVESVSPNYKRVDGQCVSVVALPYYVGPLQYVQQLQQLKHNLRQALQSPEALIFRVPSKIATLTIVELINNCPYSLEVVGDPYDVFAPGAIKHPLRPFFRWKFTHDLHRQCAGAVAAAYVTAEALQRRYPPAPDAFTTHYSSIELRDEAFAAAPRTFRSVPSPIRMIMVGTLEQLYKAPDVLIEAMILCIKRGLKVHLTLVGDGKHRPELEAKTADAGLGPHVTFTGKLSAGEAVRSQLDKVDLFVLPSRTEGLPRALIEAMARGLPCIGSTVGGIPELLPAEDMVPPGDASALADKIAEVVTAPDRMTTMAARNLQTARDYHEDILRKRRIAFYQYVKDATETWLKNKTP